MNLELARPTFVYFITVFSAAFCLGVIRTIYLVPYLGSRAAELCELPVMLLIVFICCRVILKRYSLRTPSATLFVGLGALLLLLLAEMTLGMFLRGVSPLEALINPDPVSGTLYYFSLAAFGLMPWLWVRFINSKVRIKR